MARPIDYILRVYPTEQLAIEEDQNAITALQVLGGEVTATTAQATSMSGTSCKYTLSAGQSLDLNLMFSVDEYLTVTGFSTAGNNLANVKITAVTATEVTVVSPGGHANEGPSSGTFTFTQASTFRPLIDNNNQTTTYTDEAGLSQQYNFFTQERMFYRFDVPVAASGFYVDWDDGDDNTPEKANYSVKKFDLPQNYAIFEHTYTKHGQFYPMLRVTSPHGYKSKYYTTCDAPRSSYRELEATHDLTATIQTGAAEQNLSILSLDSNSTPRIPSFVPSNYPPVGVLKIDRPSVYAGIDNSVVTEALTAANTSLDVRARAYVYIDGVDLGIRHTSGISGGVYNIPELVEVIYIDNNYTIRKELLGGTTGTGSSVIPDSVFPSDGTSIKEIISVKLRKVKELPYGDEGEGSKYNALQTGLYPDERVWIRLIDNSDIASGHESIQLFNPTDLKTVGKSYPNFCCVSNGNPYVSVNDPRYRVMADGSDSIARNSNVNIANYWLYDDKLRIRDKLGTTGTGTAIRETILNSDASAGSFIDKHTDVFGQQVESTTSPKQSITYNLDYMRGQQLDDKEFYCIGSDNAHLQGVGRFHDDFRLLRLQVEDSSEDGPNATVVEDIDGQGYRGGDRMDRSFIEHDSNYKRPNGANLEQRPGSVQSNGMLLFMNNSDVWVDLGPRNPETSKLNFGGDGSTSGSTSRLSLSDTTDINTGVPKNWLLTAKDRKFSKIFFRMDNDNIIRQTRQGSSPKVKLVAWYTGPSGWKPLAIKDETIIDHNFTDAAVGKATSLYRSGPVSWDIPEDWTSVTSNSTGYGSTWEVPDGLDRSHGDNSTSEIGGGGTVTVASKTFAGLSNADRFITGDKIAVTNTDSHDGDYTVASSTSNSITVDESLSGIDDASTRITVNHKISSSDGTTTYGAVVPFAAAPIQKWLAVNWPQRTPTGEEGGYGILIGILCTGATGIQCSHTVVCDNQHSRIIRVEDPKHISLNEAMIAQSIGFTRKGKYHSITDKLGKSEIRRLGAAGGKLSFGSVSMGKNTASEGNRTRERFVEYQKEGTPVYYDVRHNNGTYTRFFGVLESISEDIPIGLATPKIGVSMLVSHIIEYSSDGVFTSDVVSIGGLVDTDNRYLQ
tara:strand:+ start:2030 stop:5395 length:3366 start_codon:yes stop_codon:yes gene_type:complete